MNIVNAIDNGEKPQPIDLLKAPKINIREIKTNDNNMPATMLAKRRMINANGFINTLRNSTGTKMSLTPNGNPAD